MICPFCKKLLPLNGYDPQSPEAIRARVVELEKRIPTPENIAEIERLMGELSHIKYRAKWYAVKASQKEGG